ncbi:hypothetical protein [Salinicola rhizosphaerae]|uniref:Uncharacterized protein n=1 Tax=Salinicola rhizosphaerae TaxID=1443141 RepID=A0ABQ3ECP4_9GAMM|nr:hypothetical protein [Salinicola rhizosphaerae]GHB30535.1 hypothetical protein GCM10009038_31660 [Salinicola rhizosphaerae]
MLTSILIFLIGLVGAALVSFGAWLLAPPAGFIVAGVLCLSWSALAARTAARRGNVTAGEGA